MRIVEDNENVSGRLPDGLYFLTYRHRLLVRQGAIYVPLETLDVSVALKSGRPLQTAVDPEGSQWLFMRAADVAAVFPDFADNLKALATRSGCTL